MTSLEKFLIKKPETKTSEETKKESTSNQGPNNQLVSTISQLKAIFPNESEENLTLLALQHQNPRDLEEAVQRLLEKGKAFQEFKDEWNTVTSRDKKKPEVKKEYRKKRFQKDYEEENQTIPGYSTGKGRPQKNKRQENSYRPRDTGRTAQGYIEKNKEVHERSEVVDEKLTGLSYHEESSQGIEENRRSVEETKKNTEETRHQPEDLRKNEPSLNQNYEFPTLHAEKVWNESPPQEIKVAKFSHPPATIPEETKPLAEVPEKIVPAKSQDSKSSGLKSETRDFGVQVDFDYGIPIIVYPYMFGRAK